MNSRLKVFLARDLYPLLSPISAAVRRLAAPSGTPPLRLPKVRWSKVIPRQRIQLAELSKSHGNVRSHELAVLASAAASVLPGEEIIEIGTFDGRTTLNLALNAPPQSRVFTIDLPADATPAYTTGPTELDFIRKPEPGVRYKNYRGPGNECRERIVQYTGDSATFDWAPHFGRAGLVFVDGAHAYDYVLHDSETAFRLVSSNGMVLWHDYGIWNGVTEALNELEATRQMGLRHVRGTTLVVWKSTAPGW
ncbi:MAG: class I SAM-dependent methyltransferase [Chthoniobacterales bacterium]